MVTCCDCVLHAVLPVRDDVHACASAIQLDGQHRPAAMVSLQFYSQMCVCSFFAHNTARFWCLCLC